MKATLVKQPAPPPPPSTVQLTMSLEEARDLVDICRNVATNVEWQTTARRMRAYRFLGALKDAGVAK